MTEPIWSTNVFEPAKNGTTVRLNDMQTNAIPPGIYTVWIEGESGNPYYQRRQVPVPVRVQTDGNNDGDYNDAVDVKVTRDFSLDNSVLDGSTATLGGTISLPLRVSTGNGTTNWGSGPAAETNVSLSWDTDTLTTCSLQPASLGMGTIGFSSSSVTPTTGTGTAVTLTINTAGLAQGCYLFTIRAHGVNSNGQPVTPPRDRPLHRGDHDEQRPVRRRHRLRRLPDRRRRHERHRRSRRDRHLRRSQRPDPAARAAPPPGPVVMTQPAAR